jgi:hydroxyacylglutathione hydrolase
MGAGSVCGKAMSHETVSTIGDQGRFNEALQPMEQEQFLQIVTPTKPAFFELAGGLAAWEAANLPLCSADRRPGN